MIEGNKYRWLIATVAVMIGLAVVSGGVIFAFRSAGEKIFKQTPVPSFSEMADAVDYSTLPTMGDGFDLLSPTVTSSSLISTSPTQNASTQTNASSTSGQTNARCVSIDQLLKTFEQTTPTWSELECQLVNLSRQSLPSFYTRISVDYDALAGIRNNIVATYRGWWDQYRQDYGTNLSSASSVGMPPFVGVDGQVMAYPLSAANFDAKMRGAAVAYLAEKLAGRIIMFQTFHPPSELAPVFVSADEFRSWIRDTWLSQKKTEAEVAEKLKAEYYVPFPIEADIFFNQISQPNLAALSNSDLVSLAQEWVDQTRETVRPIYKGRLVIQLAANYSSFPFWTNLRTTGFDELTGTLLPSCDFDSSKTYVESQLAGYTAIASRDNVPWSIGELGLFNRYFQACSHDKADFEVAIYQEVFRQLDAAFPPPVGINIDGTDPTGEARQVIKDYFESHAGG